MKKIIIFISVILIIGLVVYNNFSSKNQAVNNTPITDNSNEVISENTSKENTSISNEYTDKNIIENYTYEALTKLNIFLSNFSEVDFSNFEINNYDDKELIQFALDHIRANDYIKIKYSQESDSNGNYTEYVDESDVQNIIKKYFGFKVTNQSLEHFEFVNDKYIFPLASGTLFPKFTQVRKIYKEGNTLRVLGEIYYPINFDDTSDNSWRYEFMEDPASNKKIKYVSSIEAVIHLINDSDGNQTYKLLNYKEEVELFE